jgi:hypothetical protein
MARSQFTDVQIAAARVDKAVSQAGCRPLPRPPGTRPST